MLRPLSSSQVKMVWPMSMISIPIRTIKVLRHIQQWRFVEYLDGGLATAGLLSNSVQTGVQNVPVDLQLVALRLLETLG